MEAEDSKSPIIVDERAARREKIVNGIWFGYNALTFIVTFGLYIFTIVIAIPVLQTCYIVAVVIMLLGTALGLIQVKMERNFPLNFSESLVIHSSCQNFSVTLSSLNQGQHVS